MPNSIDNSSRLTVPIAAHAVVNLFSRLVLRVADQVSHVVSFRDIGNTFMSRGRVSQMRPCRGEVFLVGAGPGDPELLTIRAARVLSEADVIVYDRLVSEEIMRLCPKQAEYIYVGKKRAQHVMQQVDINQTLVDQAKAGKRVVRLKGGDPFIFGRGGEELETLAANGVAFQVVPGVTAASGCSSYAGIPLTHRDHAQSCVFVTGHVKDGSMHLPWAQLAQVNQTIACYMGLKGLPIISEKLIEHGLDPATPAALIENGTTTDQRVIETTLAELAEAKQKVRAGVPMMLIVGGVVALRSELAWFEIDQKTVPERA